MGWREPGGRQSRWEAHAVVPVSDVSWTYGSVWEDRHTRNLSGGMDRK